MQTVRRVAGIDVGFPAKNRARAAVAVLDMETLQPQEIACAESPCSLPYIPGLLSFREAPAILKALEKLSSPPQLMLFDGQGIAHPRGLGIASHLGLITGIPSIGVGKTRLFGSHATAPGKKGEWTPLQDGEREIGAVLCNRDNTKPLYVSVGHGLSLEMALDAVALCSGRFRLPETTRWADGIASRRPATMKALGRLNIDNIADCQ